MSRVTRKDRIRNTYVRGSIGVWSIDDKMREYKMTQFAHVMRKKETKAVRL